jgi:hypothetical protein
LQGTLSRRLLRDILSASPGSLDWSWCLVVGAERARPQGWIADRGAVAATSAARAFR